MPRAARAGRRPPTAAALGLVTCLLACLVAQGAAAQAPRDLGGPRQAGAEPPRHVIVRFKRDADASDRAAARRAADVDFEQALPLPRGQLVDPEPGVSVTEAVDRLERSPAVSYAEPDVARSALALPTDTYFRLQWGLENTGGVVAGVTGIADADIDASEAWAAVPGATGIAVAVVDSGIATSHPDLAANVWRNPGESGAGREANRVDDDANGFVDDVRGWDWVQGDADPQDANGHGTHVAGTIGAVGNNAAGVAGVAWRTQLVPLRVLGQDGSGRVSDVLSAYAYAATAGVRIVNASLGGPSPSRAERDAIAAAGDILFVVAAGNDGQNNDTAGSYPCNYELENVICVAAADQTGALAAFSNHGARTVDLAAPGVNIASTYPPSGFAYMDGTSMATPHVAGVASLVWHSDPEASVAELRGALLDTSAPVSGHSGRTVTGGMLNAAAAVADAIAPPEADEPEPPDVGAPEGAEPSVAEPEAPGAGAPDAEAPLPEAGEPDEPEIGQPEPDEPESGEPEPDEPEPDEPEPDEPEPDEPEGDEPEGDEAESDEPETDEPEASEPVPSDAGAAPPAADEPAPTGVPARRSPVGRLSLRVTARRPKAILVTGRDIQRGVSRVRATAYWKPPSGRRRRAASRTARVRNGAFRIRIANYRRGTWTVEAVGIRGAGTDPTSRSSVRRGLSSGAGTASARTPSSRARAKFFDALPPGPLSDGGYLATGVDAPDRVLRAERLLRAAGIKSGVDGRFDRRTERAVRRFQRAHGLVVDGIVGRQTWAALLRYRG